MSIRTWEATQSAQIELADGVYPVVTQDDLVKALYDLAILVDRAGGVGGLVVQRVPTGVPNSYVTVRALVTWQDRTNAKPQPEPNVLEEDPSAVLAPAEAAAGEVFDDGLQVDRDAVDESDVPEALRQG